MNMHVLYDQMTVSMAASLARNFRFFCDSLESADLPTHVGSIRMEIPAFDGKGTFEVPAHSLAGDLDPAFRVAQWLGDSYPTVIYHHGNNERPFDFGMASKNSFKNIFMTGKPAFPANLIALRAPYHQDLRVYMDRVRRLDQFAALLAASVRLTEGLVSALREKSGGQVIVAGASLGGWVTNLHKAICDSADAYAPLLAGAALDEVFLSSMYSRLAGENVRANPQAVHDVLNFEELYAARSLSNVFPLLARFDQIIVYERQKACYGDWPVTVIDKGHTTTALDAKAMRAHVLGCLQPVGV
jgi:hypothetical protein